jgi:predicted anti-sigma-YlaC factor YlaD
MLNCKQVATQASDYLDNHVDGKLRWKIRMHLLMCSHCRRFIRHLRITRDVAGEATRRDDESVEAEIILKKIKNNRFD